MASLFTMKKKEDEKEKESRKTAGRFKARQNLGKFGRWLLFLLPVGQSWPCVSAAAEGQQTRMEGWLGCSMEVQVKESR